jgi:hypothetical protein
MSGGCPPDYAQREGLRQSAVAGLGTGWRVTVTAHADALPGADATAAETAIEMVPESSERRHSVPPDVYARTAMTGALVLTLVLAAQVLPCSSASAVSALTHGFPLRRAWTRGAEPTMPTSRLP